MQQAESTLGARPAAGLRRLDLLMAALLVLVATTGLAVKPYLRRDPLIAAQEAYRAGSTLDPWGKPWIDPTLPNHMDGGRNWYSAGPNGVDEKQGGDDVTLVGRFPGTIYVLSIPFYDSYLEAHSFPLGAAWGHLWVALGVALVYGIARFVPPLATARRERALTLVVSMALALFLGCVFLLTTWGRVLSSPPQGIVLSSFPRSHEVSVIGSVVLCSWALVHTLRRVVRPGRAAAQPT